ncbi:MAG: VPLPA-CTERM-specific exosortase XrtD [Gammaproteobacteria bacterium]|nr:VPLPA-CTERM-specific exosortase XrtD [Gammaproteobacteria bacterium]
MATVKRPQLSFAPPLLLALVVAAALLILVFQGTFQTLYGQWQREEYSHGFLIPLISAYLLWQRRDRLQRLVPQRSWAGVALAAFGLLLFFLSALASITTLDGYALVIVIAGGALAVLGWEGFKVVAVPIALLFLMNPIPSFFYNSLSLQLQLLSSQIGVGIMRLAGVSVFLEGNVIDLGRYKLQVAEACSGLRYLFPLMTLGVVVAYLFKGKAWVRWTLFLSTVPITVLMNSVRVGIIGLLVDRYGIEQAEGFLHDFEGWAVFMVCILLLLGEAWALMRLTGDRRPLSQLLVSEPATPGVRGTPMRELGKPALMVLLMLTLAVLPARALPTRGELHPQRAEFASFPLELGAWEGRRDHLEAVYLDWLKVDDYFLANFVARETASVPDSGTAETARPPLVNLYIAYYASQRTGQSAHSPRSCLPGGGWMIRDFGQRALWEVREHGAPLRVNRALVEQGASRQLVYYWFEERGRDITSEYLVKWYLVEDALLRNRTDGALVRLVTPLADNEAVSAADARLVGFARAALPTLQHYLPE